MWQNKMNVLLSDGFNVIVLHIQSNKTREQVAKSDLNKNQCAINKELTIMVKAFMPWNVHCLVRLLL